MTDPTVGYNSGIYRVVSGTVGADGEWVGSGLTTKTVGAGGDFSTIADAITWLSGQTLLDQITTSPLDTMTVDLTQHSDTVVTSEPTLPANEDRLDIFTNDLMFVDNDANGTWGGLGSPSTHYYPVLKKGNQPSGATENETVTLYSGIIGSNKTTYSATWWRPRKYAIMLLPGRHQIPTNITIPNGCNLYIGGFGQATEVYGTMDSGTGGLATTAFLAPRYGFVHLDNMTFQGTNIFSPWDDQIPNFSESTAVLKLTNLAIRASAQILRSTLLHGLIVQNVHVYDCMDHGMTLAGDFLLVDGFYARTSEGSEAAYFNFSGNYWTVTTKEKYIRNIQVERYEPSPNRGSSAALRIVCPTVYGSPTIIKIANSYILENIGYTTTNYCTRIDAGGAVAQVDFYFCIMDGRAPYTADVRTNGGANLTANFINCMQPDGTTLTFSDDGGGATILNRLPTWV